MAGSESEIGFPFTEFPVRSSMNHRPHLLFNSGVIVLSIAHKVYTKVEELHGPLGSLAQALASFASPLLYTMQHQWLTLLAFTDDQIVTVENMVETIFPPSAYLFDQFDHLNEISETLPEKFDALIDNLPELINHVPCLECASTQLSFGLSFLFSMLPEWVLDRLKEEEEIDIDHDELVTLEKLPVYDKIRRIESMKAINGKLTLIINSPILRDIHNESGGELTANSRVNDKIVVSMDSMCNEIRDGLETWKKEDGEGMKEERLNCMQEVHGEMETRESRSIEVAAKADPILELFEAGWHTNLATKR